MTKTILDIQNLSISFDGFKALNNVSTKVEEGSIHFLSALMELVKRHF